MKKLTALAILAMLFSGSAHAQNVCKEYEQTDCLRLDIPSILAGDGVVNGQDGKPSGPKNVQAMREGKVRHAGKRSYVVYVWPDRTPTPANRFGVYVDRGDGKNMPRMTVGEITMASAPRFDPAHKPPGNPQIFRVTADGPMVSFQIPWASLGNAAHILICGEGRTVFPDRVTKHEGIWVLPADLNRMRGKNNYATMKAFVW